MEQLGIGLARSIWLFDINELNPTGKSIFPEMLIWFGEKYSFQTYPKSLAELDKEAKAFVFKAGEFQTENDTIVVNLSLYNDGIVAETWASTEKTDAFIEEVLRSATSKYGLVYRPEMIRSKQYVSEIIFRLDVPLYRLNPKVVAFCDSLTTAFRKHNLPPFELSAIEFSPDSSATAYKPPGLTIARRIGAPFAENRFWSKSPFPTSDHLRLLREFEELLADY